MHQLCVKKAPPITPITILLIGRGNPVSFATRNEAPVNINIRKARRQFSILMGR
jgi:hypothetical protein